MNDLLSICIPTYKRPSFLKANLESLILQVAKYDIPIYISDNASGDETAKVVEEIKCTYPYIFYSCNDRNYGPDYNITKVLRAAESRYAWFLGDDDMISAGGIDVVMEILQSGNYDLVVVNGDQAGRDRVADIKSAVYTDRNRLLGELGWHMTWLSCIILSSDLIRRGQFDKYIGTYLVHVGTMFEYLADRDISVFWSDERMICGIEGNESSWTGDTFSIWIENWIKIISALPACYAEEAKLKCIKDHGPNSHVFSLKHLLGLRALNVYNFRIYEKYRQQFRYVTDVPLPALLSVSLLPLGMMKIVHLIWKAYKGI